MENGGLKKELGFIASISIVVGMVIGSGVFFKPTAVFGTTGAPGLGILAWVIAGGITLAGGLTTAEIGAAIPKTGGMIAWLEEAFGSVWGFTLGWVETIVFFPATIAALAIIFATQAVSLLGLNQGMIQLIAIVSTIFLILMNSLGSKVGGAIQTVFTIGKLIPLIAIIVFGFLNGNGGMVRLLPITDPNHPTATSLGAALLGVMFAYEGWIQIGVMAGELKNPQKDLPKAIIGGLSIVMAVYILINIAYLYVLPASALAATKTPAADVATILFGKSGGKFITVGILVSIFGALNGNILAAIRIPYAMAIENKLPGSKWLSKLHSQWKTPVNCGIVIGIITIIMILSGNYDQLTDLVVFVIWIFYVLTFVAVIKFRVKNPNMEKPYKTPFYPITPIVAIAGGMYIIIATVITQPANAGIGVLLTVIGLPVFYYRKNKGYLTNNEISDDI